MPSPFTDLDEEEQRKADKEVAAARAALSSFEKQEPAPAEPWSALAGLSADATPPRAESDDGAAWEALANIGDPPKRSDDTGGLIAAALLDFALNKGRNAGTIVGHMTTADPAYENYQRQLNANKSKADILRRQRGGVEANPEVLELRRQSLGVSRDREKRLKEHEDNRVAERAENSDPNSERARRAKTFLVEMGVPAERIEGLSVDEMKSLSPQIRKLVDFSTYEQSNEIAADRARKVAAAQQPFKLEVAERGAGLRREAEEPKVYEAQANKYADDTKFLRVGASFLQSAEGVLGRYKESDDVPGVGVVDSRTPDWGIGDDGLELRKAQDWMNNAIQRADSGAAAPIQEELKFAIRSGSKPGATEKEFRAGMKAARQYLRGQLRASSAGKEGAAREVLRLQGIEDWVFDDEDTQPDAEPRINTMPREPDASTAIISNEQRKKMPPWSQKMVADLEEKGRRVREAEQGDDGSDLGVTTKVGPKVNKVVKAEPQKPIGTRNGKPVVSMRKQVSADGGVRVVIRYQDGSVETVEK